MTQDNLKEFYIEQLRELYSAEMQLQEGLSNMAQVATSPQLRKAFLDHLVESRDHIRRIEILCQEMKCAPQHVPCKAMAVLIQDGEELVKGDLGPSVLDAGLIAAAQRIEHYEIAGYGALQKYALLLGDNNAASILQATLNEEYDADNRLDKLLLSLSSELLKSIGSE